MLGACSADETYLAAARIARQSLEDILRRGTTCETSTAGHARQITQARPYVATSPPSFRRKLDARACRGRGRASELVVEVGSPGWARVWHLRRGRGRRAAKTIRWPIRAGIGFFDAGRCDTVVGHPAVLDACPRAGAGYARAVLPRRVHAAGGLPLRDDLVPRPH